MSNNDNSLIDRLATIIKSPPASLNITGNQLNRLRKDKSQYETYIRDLNLYKGELEDSVKYINPIIDSTFNKLKEELTKIIYSIIKNLKEAETSVNSVIKSPENVIHTDINVLNIELLKKIESYFGLEEKYAYIQQQIRIIENSIQYQDELEAVRRQRAYDLEFPSSTYYVRPGITGRYATNNNNNSNINTHPNNINNVFLPKSNKKPIKKEAIVGSLPVEFKTSPSNENVLIELGSPSKGGGTYYENENDEGNEEYEIKSTDSNNKSKPLPPTRNERINIQPSYIPQVVNTLKKYLLSESRTKNVNTNRLAKLQLIKLPSQLLAALKTYNTIIIKQHNNLQEKLKQQSVRILEELKREMTKLKMEFYIKEQVPLKINEINEYIENLGGPFTNKNLYINKKVKAITNIKPPSKFNRTLRKIGWNTTVLRRNRNANTRPWYKRLFTKRQPPPTPTIEPESLTTIRWKNRIEETPLTSTVEYEPDKPVTSLRRPANVAESVGPEPNTVAVNWAVQPAPTSWWGRIFRRGPTIVRTTVGTVPPTRKWWKFLGGKGRNKTRKLRK